MKIRNGFVSNSSSSSFIVHYRKTEWTGGRTSKPKPLFSKETLKKLKKFGFKYSNVSNPYYVSTPVETKGLKLQNFSRYENVHLTYDVTCNQDEVILFLLENKVPFVALCHYDQELIVWDGKGEYFYEMPNPLESVCRDNGQMTFDVGENAQYFPSQLSPKIRKYKIDEWVEKEREFWGKL